MKIATLISLAGTVTSAGIFTFQKQWAPAATFILLSAYTLLDKVVHLNFLPGMVVEALPVIALVLAVYEILRKLVGK